MCVTAVFGATVVYPGVSDSIDTCTHSPTYTHTTHMQHTHEHTRTYTRARMHLRQKIVAADKERQLYSIGVVIGSCLQSGDNIWRCDVLCV